MTAKELREAQVKYLKSTVRSLREVVASVFLVGILVGIFLASVFLALVAR